MASRRFFAYDPYDYYYPAPYHYPYPYYHHHSAPVPAPATAPSRSDVKAFFPAGGYDAEPPVRAAAHQPRPRTRWVSVPVQFVGSKPEPEPERQESRVPPVAGRMAEAAVPAKKRAPSAEEAAVRMQAAARGFLVRRMVREVRAVGREAEGVAARVAAEAEALRGNARARVAVGEELMRLLLRLDAVHGAREYRRRVTKKVLALQDAVDALEPRAAAKPAAVEMAEEHAAEEGQMAPDLLDGEDHGVDMDAKTAVDAPATETAAEMEVDGVRAIGERDAEDAANSMDDGEKPEAAEGEWEMVAEESAAACITGAAEAGAAPEERQEEPAGEEEEKKAEGGAANGLDAWRVMEMVAALCERSAQQCTVIGALAERVDELERAVRRVEGADRRRRRNKKLKFF